MKSYALAVGFALVAPACDPVGDLGQHESESAAGEGGGGAVTLCTVDGDCDGGEVCDRSTCQPCTGEDCEDVCYGECVAASQGSGGAEGGGEGGQQTCGESACEGPAPAAPSIMCPDGSVAGPACLDDGEGGCAWGLLDCPPFDCTEAECGPPPGAPNYLCPDGVTMGGPGPCTQLEDGTCGYPWVDCDGCCDTFAMPMACPSPSCCEDGDWSCADCAGAPGMICDDGGACVPDTGSCAAGESCCPGLSCCAGVPVPPGQEYCANTCPVSDRNKKENFSPVDVQAMLDRVSRLEITSWNYKFEDDAIRHVGPMAQDFKASFEVGATDKAIFTVDADGVALAAIQALDAENKALKRTIDRLERRLRKLERRTRRATP